jgi:rhamnose transport system substrate-binding protein
MKIRNLVRAAGATAALSALILAGCAAGTTEEAPASGDAPAASGDMLKVAFVPKLQGVPYFEAMNTGGQAAAAEYGFEWLYQGPVEADAAAQADVVRGFIQQGVDVLIVAPNDPDSMAPLLEEAAAAGIKVATSDTDAPNSVREVFVNQATAQGIGEGIIDALMAAMGGAGEFAIVSCGETAANLNSWIEVQKTYVAEAYPDATLTEIVYAGEDQAKGTEFATNLMNANPNLTGLIGQCTTSAPGAAQAIRDLGKIGTVFSVGLGTPQSMKEYLADGSSSAAILWDVENLGYLTGWAGFQLATGGDLAPSGAVAERIPDASFDPATKVLLLGPALRITAENVDNFSY